jgi:hypothetical protein
MTLAFSRVEFVVLKNHFEGAWVEQTQHRLQLKTDHFIWQKFCGLKDHRVGHKLTQGR